MGGGQPWLEVERKRTNNAIEVLIGIVAILAMNSRIDGEKNSLREASAMLETAGLLYRSLVTANRPIRCELVFRVLHS